MTSERILVMDGDTTQALACVRALGADGHQVMVASEQRASLATWSRYCKGNFRLASQSISAYADLRAWAVKESVGVVLPMTERSALLLDAERAQWEAAGIIIGAGAMEMLVRAFDKGQTIEYARDCGVRTPLTRIPESFEETISAVEEMGFHCVIKPRWSSALNGTTLHPNRVPAYVNGRDGLKQIILARKQGSHWPLVQKIVTGQGKGVSTIFDRGRPLVWFAHERMRDTRPTGSGSNLRRAIPITPRLLEPAERLLSAMNWHGPAMVEFKDDGVAQPCLMEVNGRFWGSLQLAIDAGVNFPVLWLALVRGEKIHPVSKYAEGVYLRWLWGDVKRFAWILRGAPTGYTEQYPTVLEGLRELFGRQPAGTRLETWRAGDRWPAVGELAEGCLEFVQWFRSKSARLLRPNTPIAVEQLQRKLDLGESV